MNYLLRITLKPQFSDLKPQPPHLAFSDSTMTIAAKRNIKIAKKYQDSLETENGLISTLILLEKMSFFQYPKIETVSDLV